MKCESGGNCQHGRLLRWSDPGETPEYLQRSVPEWLAADVVLEIVGGRRAFERFVREGHDEQRRDDLSGRGERGREEPGERRVWLGGQVLGSASQARRVVRKARQREAERELARASAADLPALAARVAYRTGVTVEALRASGRPRAISAARRELIRVAVLEHGLRRVDVSRFLGVSRSSVTEQVYGKGNS